MLGINSQFLIEAAKAEAKWSKQTSNGRSILDGITDPFERKAHALIIENQHLYNESGTDTSDVANFKKISIPLVRRVFPNLIANKIVTVQPLLGPVGLVYYLRFLYSSDKGSTYGASTQNGFPNDDALTMGQRANGDANLDIDYTSSIVNNEKSSVDSGISTKSVFQPLLHTPILPGTVSGVVYKGTTALQSFAVSENGTFTFTNIATNPTDKAIGGSVDLVTGELSIDWNNAPGENHVVLTYQYNLECNQDLPEMRLSVENEHIMAIERKLRASWSLEVTQDLRSQHDLNIESELTSVMAQEINLEIDREIIRDLRTNAGTNTFWDYQTSIGHTIKEKYESLMVKLTETSNVVFRKNMRGACNWLICSPEVASIFETSVAGFVPSTLDQMSGDIGIQYVGSVQSKWKVYKDPLFPRDQIVMGFKGSQHLDTGYYYCPYVPLYQTGVLQDPHSGCQNKIMATRYGKKMLRDGAKFFARVSLYNYNI